MLLTDILNFFLNTLLKVFFLFCFSLSLRFILQYTGQSWIKTTSHTATIFTLPIITFVITSVISGNIALSLGMVGALSIVRFRNPVRSPLELTVYFTSITMGITASASLKWLFLLMLSLYLIIFLLFIFSTYATKIMKKNFFITSFSEGNSLSTLEVTSSKKIKILDESEFLKSLSSSSEGQKQYLLASNNFNYLRKLITELDKNEFILNYQLNEC